MSDIPEETLPQPPIEILQSAATIIEQIQPEVLRTLGSIATLHDAPQDEAWALKIRDAAERIQAAASFIITSVAEVSIEPLEVETPETPEEVVEAPAETTEETPEVAEVLELTSLQKEILEYARAQKGQPFRVEVMSREIETLKKLKMGEYTDFKKGFDKDRAAIVASLAAEGIEAAWEKSGKARGTKYQYVEAGMELQPVEEIAEVEVAEAEQPAESEAPAPAPAPVEAEQPAAEVVESSEVTPEEPKEDPTEPFAELVEDLQLTPNELAVVREAVKYLVRTGERQTLRNIINEVFSDARLPRDEEARLTQILSEYADNNLLEKYGKTYGYVQPEDQPVTKSMVGKWKEKFEQLSEEEQRLVALVDELTESPEGIAHVGHIVRRTYRTQTVDEQTYKALLGDLNDLVKRGYIVHTPGTPQYASAAVLSMQNQQKRRAALLPITTIPHVTSAIAETVVTEEAVTEPVAAPAVEVTPAQPKNKELNERDTQIFNAILSSIQPNEWFAQKNIDLTGITFTSESARSQAMSKLFTHLVNEGTLINNGKSHGGKRYMLVSEVEQPQEQAAPEQEPEVATEVVPAQEAELVAAERPAESVAPTRRQVPAVEELSPREERIRFQKAARFATAVTTGISEIITQGEDQKERMAAVQKYIATKLNITKGEARDVISNLVAEEHLYLNGNRRGSRLVGMNPHEETEPKRTKNATTNGKSKESQELTEEDIQIASSVFDKLLELTHVQQSLTIKSLTKELGLTGEQEQKLRRSLRRIEKHGYLFINNKATVATRSPHSSRLNMPAVKLPTQAFKDRLKTDKSSVLEELRSLIG